MVYLWQILVFAIVIGPLVFVHELGHFLVAKLFRVGVVRFAIGFGPALFRIRIGETIYQLGAIPLGGFVRMVGDIPDSITPAQPTDKAVRDGEEATREVDPDESDPFFRAMLEDRSRWFLEKPLFERSLIVFAGPAFNFLFAIILVSVCALIYGKELPVEEARIGVVAPNSPAERAGLRGGDLVLTVDGVAPRDWENLAQMIRGGTGESMTLRVLRENAHPGADEELEVVVRPERKEVRGLDGSISSAYMIGIGSDTYRVSIGIFESAKLGVLWSVGEVYRQCLGVLGMITGEISPKDLAGPLFIFKYASKQAERGFETLILFISSLSISLAVLNLLPIPVLDGGHLMFFLLEAIFGPMSVRKKEFAQQLGVMLLFLLMAFALGNDITRNMNEVERGIEWGKNSSATTPPEPQLPSSSPIKEGSTP